MTNLYKFVGQKVIIIDINNKEWQGFVIGYDSSNDSEDGQQYLDVEVADFGILSIAESEIKSIKAN